MGKCTARFPIFIFAKAKAWGERAKGKLWKQGRTALRHKMA